MSSLIWRPIWICCLVACASVHSQIPKELRPETLQSKHGFQWREAHSARIDFRFESASYAERDIAKIETSSEADLSRILRLLGSSQMDFRLQAFIVETRTRMKQLCGKEMNGMAVGPVFLFVYGNAIKALGAHEPCHILSRHIWGRSHSTWLTEGLAVYADDGWQGHPLNGVCKKLRIQKKLMPITELFDDKKWRRLPVMVSYPEAGSFIKFLYERYGMDTVRLAWERGESALPLTTGKSAMELEAEWFAVVDASDAGDFNYRIE